RTQRRLLAALGDGLEALETAPAATRVALARDCAALLDELAGGSQRSAGPERAAPGEDADTVDRPHAGPGAPGPTPAPATTVTPPGPAPVYDAGSGDVAAALEQLRKPLQFVRGVGPALGQRLGKFGLVTVEDILYHLPMRYEDRTLIETIAAALPGSKTTIGGELVQLAERTVGQGRRKILEGVLRDSTGLLALTWFRQVAYFRTRFQLGQRLLVHGKVDRTPAGGKRIVHPEIEAVAEQPAAGVQPVYEKPTAMTVGHMRKLAQQAARDFAASVPGVIPPAIATAARIADPAAALRALHLPAPDAAVEALNAYASAAHRALVFDELFFLQLGLGVRRRQTVRETGLSQPRQGTLTDPLSAALPFALTGAQRRVLDEIYADMGAVHPMHRLVQGDVGSGKTVVALFAALVAIENGGQAAVMAPTELLAEQHFRTIARLAEPLGVRVALLTGDAAKSDKRGLHAALATGEIQLAVGTHALIQSGVQMPHLALGVVDEQHRFGVLQRAALRALRGDPDGPAPDILLMTATPIPRTLAMTIYGDLDVSLLDEMPPGRKPVRTRIVNDAARADLYRVVREHLERGQQAYVVYPLVDVSEKEDLRDATTMAKELARTVFPGFQVGLLHGRMKADEKDAVMRAFRAGHTKVLVSTTVSEVGVDVPNATVMVIEHAERFGLSQLHQLRGRVGRGSEDSICLLVAPYHGGEDVVKRLNVMRQTGDGFKIAEADLAIRGPGDFLGTRQSGLPDFRVTNLIRDTRTLAEARDAAEHWLDLDPELRAPESAALRLVLEHRWKGRLGLAGIG
ncbi:MAG: ATP-dependent DNA helicase RecG, partial [Candidatus Binatia bacterium]